MTYNSYLNEYNEYINAHKLSEQDKKDVFFHKHHIIPQCIGGSDDESNIACLIPKDHVKAHELLYKAYHACAIELAHVLVSMIGKDNCNNDIVNDNMLDQYNIQMVNAYRLIKAHKGNMAKRTIYKVSDLSSRRIFKDEPLPNGYVECPTIRNAWIFNNNYIRRRWDKDNVPAGWKLIANATQEEFDKVFPNSGNNGMKGAIWIHNPLTKEMKMIRNGQIIPDGWKRGAKFSDAAKQKQTVGGLKTKAIVDELKSKYNGIRWVHDINTGKNKMIGKTQPLPDGFAEGLISK